MTRDEAGDSSSGFIARPDEAGLGVVPHLKALPRGTVSPGSVLDSRLSVFISA